MDFNLFIIPITMIITQLAKGYIPKKHLPPFAVFFGAVAGIAFGVYYGQDLVIHGVQGLAYGAAAAGIYDLAKSTIVSE